MRWAIEANDKGEISVTVGGKRPLPELSFAIQTAVGWFLGSGVWRFEFGRYRLDNGDCKIVLRPLVTPAALQCSAISQLGALLEGGLVPRSVPQGEEWHRHMVGGQREAADGMNRVYDSDEGSLFVHQDINPSASIADLAFAMADQITGFFWRGVKTGRFQVSQALMEVWFNKHMDEKEVVRYAADPKDYNERSLVNQMR